MGCFASPPPRLPLFHTNRELNDLRVEIQSKIPNGMIIASEANLASLERVARLLVEAQKGEITNNYS